MPKAENNTIGNRSWAQKKVLYGLFAARTIAVANRAIEQARGFGFNVDKTARELVNSSMHLPMCEAVSLYDGVWNEAFIARRSTRLAELAWDRMWIWLQAPAAPARGRRRRA